MTEKDKRYEKVPSKTSQQLFVEIKSELEKINEKLDKIDKSISSRTSHGDK